MRHRNNSGGTIAIVLGCIGAVILIAAIVVGGWKLNWWLTSYGVSKNASIQQHSYGAQTGDEQAVQQYISEINGINVQITTASPAEATALAGQKQALVNQACNIAVHIDQPTADVQAFVSTNCN